MNVSGWDNRVVPLLAFGNEAVQLRSERHRMFTQQR